ncbi:MAG: hypothetical protein RCG15_02445 [Candidatus Rickettsia vulgarisii]
MGKNPKVFNKQPAYLFVNTPDDKIKEGAGKIAKINDNAIKELVNKYGPGTEKKKKI